MNSAQLHQLILPHTNLKLECDGMTRVIDYLFSENDVVYNCYIGSAIFLGKVIAPHYWIELHDGRIVDYTATMWFGDIPFVKNGIFEPSESHVQYICGTSVTFDNKKFYFDLFTAYDPLWEQLLNIKPSNHHGEINI